MAEKFIAAHTELRDTASITISGRQGVIVAWSLFWRSLYAILRRDSVTFYLLEDVPRA